MSDIRYLLDTNIVIGRLKCTQEVMVLVDTHGFDFDNSAISQITRIELLCFPHMDKEEDEKINAFLNDCQIIMCDEQIEQVTIKLRRAFNLKLPDAIIAATAKVNNLELLTLDQKLLKALTKSSKS